MKDESWIPIPPPGAGKRRARLRGAAGRRRESHD